MNICISLMDMLIDARKTWKNTFQGMEECDYERWISRGFALQPDRILSYAEEHSQAFDLINMVVYHDIEPDVCIWCPGEQRAGVGRIADEWLRKHYLHGDSLIIYDDLSTLGKVWKPDLFLTRSSLLALQAIERGSMFVGLMDGFPLTEIITSPEQLYPDAIFTVKDILSIKELICEVNYAICYGREPNMS